MKGTNPQGITVAQVSEAVLDAIQWRQWRPSSVAARLIVGSVLLCTSLSIIQFILYPMVLRDSLWHWASYWLYLLFGVMLPGTFVLVRSIRQRTDWLIWIGLGWAVGHGLELVFLLVAKQFDAAPWFLLWVPCAYVFALTGRNRWQGTVEVLPKPRNTCAALLILFMIGAVCFFALNLPEMSARPPIGSDQWFHINNAHEFRDHRVAQDPRLAGDRFNYHMFSYAPAAAASLVTGTLTADLIARYAGMSAVFLVALLLFNIGRVLSDGRVIAGVMSTLFFLAPVDVVTLVVPQFTFGTSIMIFGTYGSTSTLGGYVFLIALLLPLFWFYESGRWQEVWIVALFAFGGAGAKSMIGPLVLCATFGVLIVRFLMHRHFEWRATLAFGAVLVTVVFVTVPLVFGIDSYRTGVHWSYAIFATANAYYPQLIGRHWPDLLVRSLWIFGFAPLFLLGAVIATWRYWKTRAFRTYALFVWALFLAALVPGLSVNLLGFTQLFFIYYGLIALGTLAGCGLGIILEKLLCRPNILVNVAGMGALLFFGMQVINPTPLTWRNAWLDIVWQSRAAYWWQHPLAGETDTSLRQAHFLCAQTGGCATLFLTTDIRRGLEWARQNTPKNSVFAVNVAGAGAYGGYSERRAFYETANYNPAVEASNYDPKVVAQVTGRRLAIQAKWQAGAPDTLAAMKAAGIDLLFVDRVNGSQLPPLSGLPPPVFDSVDFAVYRLP